MEEGIGKPQNWGSTGDLIKVQFPSGQTIRGIAGNTVNSDRVLVSGGRVFGETPPQLRRTMNLEFSKRDLAPPLELSVFPGPDEPFDPTPYKDPPFDPYPPTPLPPSCRTVSVWTYSVRWEYRRETLFGIGTSESFQILRDDQWVNLGERFVCPGDTYLTESSSSYTKTPQGFAFFRLYTLKLLPQGGPTDRMLIGASSISMRLDGLNVGGGTTGGGFQIGETEDQDWTFLTWRFTTPGTSPPALPDDPPPYTGFPPP